MTKVSLARESTSLFDVESTFVVVEWKYTKTQYSDMIFIKLQLALWSIGQHGKNLNTSIASTNSMWLFSGLLWCVEWYKIHF